MYKHLAEIAREFLKKGRAVYIEWRLKTRKWQDKDTGADRYSTEVHAEQMQMLGGRDGDHSGGHATDAPDAVPTSERRRATNQYQRVRDGSHAPAPSSGVRDMDDDIPF